MRRGKLHELVIQKMTIVREVVHHAVGVFVNNTERFELLLEADDLRRAHVRAFKAAVFIAERSVEAEKIGGLFLRLEVILHLWKIVAAVVHIEDRFILACIDNVVHERLVRGVHVVCGQRRYAVGTGFHGLKRL